MKLKEWNSLDIKTRQKLSSVVFALDGEEKILRMSKLWRHHLDEEHRKLLKAVSIKGDNFKIILTV